MNTAAYLARIGYAGPLEPAAPTLRRLHLAHLLAVPFENLDIHLGRPVVLDEARLFRKVVDNRRGGFCYELNGLFAGLLRELGFRVTLLSAGVARADGGFGPEFDHLALRVDLDEPWLADVGFGEGFREPLRLAVDGSGPYRLERDGEQWTLFHGTAPQYRFRLTPRRIDEFESMCRHHQTSPESSFTQERLATVARLDGRVTLSGYRLIRTRGEERTEETVAPAEWSAVAQREFGLDVPSVAPMTAADSPTVRRI